MEYQVYVLANIFCKYFLAWLICLEEKQKAALHYSSQPHRELLGTNEAHSCTTEP